MEDIREGVETIRRRYSKLENSPIKLARKILLGTVLGDANLVLRGRRGKARLRFRHSERQLEYLLWKVKRLGPLVGRFSVSKGIRTLDETVFPGYYIGGKQFVNYFAQSSSLECLWDTWRDFYFFKEGRWVKEIHSNVLNRLTPVSIAVWFGDDGNSSLLYGKYPRVVLALGRISKDEAERVKNFFEETFGMSSYVRLMKPKMTSWYIRFFGENAVKFLELVTPYLLEVKCLRYKLDFGAPSPINA